MALPALAVTPGAAASAGWSAVAGAGAGVGEAAPDLGHELPVVAGRVQRQLEDAEARVVGDLESCWGCRGSPGGVPCDSPPVLTMNSRMPFGRVGRPVRSGAACARSGGCRGRSARRRRGRCRGRSRRRRVDASLPRCAGVPARVVPVGERALVRDGGEVALQPHLLRAAGAAAADLVAVRVQRDQVPARRCRSCSSRRWSRLEVSPPLAPDPRDARRRSRSSRRSPARRACRTRRCRGSGRRPCCAPEGRVVDGLVVRQLALDVLVVAEVEQCGRRRLDQQVGDVLLAAPRRRAVAGVVLRCRSGSRPCRRRRRSWFLRRRPCAPAGSGQQAQAAASSATRRTVAARGDRAPCDRQQSIALQELPRAPFGAGVSLQPS